MIRKIRRGVFSLLIFVFAYVSVEIIDLQLVSRWEDAGILAGRRRLGSDAHDLRNKETQVKKRKSRIRGNRSMKIEVFGQNVGLNPNKQYSITDNSAGSNINSGEDFSNEDSMGRRIVIDTQDQNLQGLEPSAMPSSSYVRSSLVASELNENSLFHDGPIDISMWKRGREMFPASKLKSLHLNDETVLEQSSPRTPDLDTSNSFVEPSEDSTPEQKDGNAVLEPFQMCNRSAPLDLKEDEVIFGWQSPLGTEKNEKNKKQSMLLLEKHTPYGRTGNMILAVLHAFDYARDNNLVIGMRRHCWAMDAIQVMWMEIKDDNWMDRMEEALGIKIIRAESQLKKYKKVISMGARELYQYKTSRPFEETKPFHMHIIRTLFRHYNTGTGVDHFKNKVRNMCSGIDDLFSSEKSTVKYSVIHNRYLEGKGYRILKRLYRGSRCDTKGAIHMEPEYIKAILRPIGMLEHPIVFISDGEQPEVLERLQRDPETGPLIRLVSEEATWVGGDITLAIMSDVFIGNPASTMSGFINRARDSLGFNESYLFRAKTESGEWISTCNRDCIWDRRIMMSML